MEAPIAYLLSLINETLAAAIVIVSVSILLYNLTRNRHDRVARTSSVLLALISSSRRTIERRRDSVLTNSRR